MKHKDLENPDYRAWIEFLRRMEGWDAAAVRALQLGELRRIVRHAFENTAGYRERFREAGVGPDDLRTPDDLARFPFIEKETLRDNLAALADSHRIERFAVFDQFPYTHHLECGLLLTRRRDAA